MRKRLLYIGNKLSAHGSTATSIETLGPLLESEGFGLRYASSRKNKLLRLLDMLGATLRNAPKTDYVIIDTYSTANFWYAFLVSQLCRLLRLRYIPVLRGGDLPNRLERSPRLCAMIYRHAHVNVAPSGYLMQAFGKAGCPNLVYIPNTIVLENYTFRKRGAIRPRLLWVRSFSPIYNPKMAIDVASRLKQKFPDASLCMVGPDKNGLLGEIAQLARDLDADVRFTGKLSKPEWTALSEDFDIFINTTHFDNTPVSVIEAMALGLPVVSTNVGGIPFLLENERTALLVNDNDAHAMAQSIERLVESQLLSSSLAINAQAEVENFDWKRVRGQWLEILK